LRKLEVDLVAVDGETLVIAEVKTRAASEVNHPLRAVDEEKVWHLGRAARAWIEKAEDHGMAIRFDVLTVIVGRIETVEYHRDVHAMAERLPV
jgi:putative endonuclease